MNFARICFWASVLTLLLGGCSTPDSRIAKNQTEFDALPPATQAKIRAGQVEVGFTPAEVELSLGQPDRREMRTTATGTEEVWAYRSHKPTFGFGLGVAGGGGSTMTAGGVGVTTGGDRGDKLRVIFQGGKVVAIESVVRK